MRGHGRESVNRRLMIPLLLGLLCPPDAFSVDVDVERGAPGTIDDAAKDERPITTEDREHWSFRPLRRPSPPAVKNARWGRNPIDRFILRRLEEKNLVPLPPADRATLIRRVTFDLTGLPPAPSEVDAFVSDPAQDAYEQLIDRLLASTAYGERWGQHWLDLARFAETDGFEQDHLRPNAWRYRDWIIDALNRDVPYDEFVRLQIAGDEFRPGDPDAAVATGFALCGPDMTDINLKEERRHVVLNDITATVGTVFLGLNIGCAQCHDHKFDPISQADFYRLRAVFENVDLFRDHPLDGSPREESSGRKKTTKSKEQKQTANQTAKKPGPPMGRVFHEQGSKRKPSHLMVRGDFKRPGPTLLPAFPRIANPWGERVAPSVAESLPEEASTSGLRASLARWLTRPDHPLALRVIANRVWQHHFGEGLVRTPNLLGTTGQEPSHPELLDWIATELPRLDWSLKRLHRLILTSATYRQASTGLADTMVAWTEDQRRQASESYRRSLELDPENRLLARQNRRRLEGEAIRDALLSVSGRLSVRRGGPGVMPPLPREIRNSIRKDHWKVSPDEEDHRRRSIYLFVRRNLRYPFFDVFDRPDSNMPCGRRDRTTIAPQALALLNSDLTLDAARHLAGIVLTDCARLEGAARQRAEIQLAYRRSLGRRPDDAEIELAEELLRSLTTRLDAEGRPSEDLALPEPLPVDRSPTSAAAFTTFCLSLFNLNEFIYID